MFLSRYVDAKNDLRGPTSFVGAAVSTENQCGYYYSD